MLQDDSPGMLAKDSKIRRQLDDVHIQLMINHAECRIIYLLREEHKEIMTEIQSLFHTAPHSLVEEVDIALKQAGHPHDLTLCWKRHERFLTTPADIHKTKRPAVTMALSTAVKDAIRVFKLVEDVRERLIFGRPKELDEASWNICLYDIKRHYRIVKLHWQRFHFTIRAECETIQQCNERLDLLQKQDWVKLEGELVKKHKGKWENLVKEMVELERNICTVHGTCDCALNGVNSKSSQEVHLCRVEGYLDGEDFWKESM